MKKKSQKGFIFGSFKETSCACLVAGEGAASAAAAGWAAGVVTEGHAFLQLEFGAVGAGAVRLEHVRKACVVQRPQRR